MNNLGNPTFVSAAARENQVLSFNTTLTASPIVANPILRVRNGSTPLVEFALNATTPFLGAAVDGSAAFNFVAPSSVAVGGSATLPDNYQVLGRDGVVHASGGFLTATDGITTGQIILAATISVTAPGS